MSGRDQFLSGDHLAVRPYLAARSGELEPAQARQLTEHLSRCASCAAEAAGFHRLALALEAMRGLELEPPPGLLDGLVAVAARRRTNPRLVAAAAGAGGALVATAVVAGVLRSRRREATASSSRPVLARLLRRPTSPTLNLPVLGAASARAR